MAVQEGMQVVGVHAVADLGLANREGMRENFAN